MRAVLFLCALVAGSPTATARDWDGSRWAGRSGLRATLSRDGADYLLRADHAGPLGDLFSTVSRGTVLLRMRLEDDRSFSGTAYVYSTPDARTCTFPYAAKGFVSGSTMQWSGFEPNDRAPNTCTVTGTAYTTTVVRLVWSPPAPPPAAPAPINPPSVTARTELAPARPEPLPPIEQLESVSATTLFWWLLLTAALITVARFLFRVRSRALQLPDLPPRPEPSRFASPLPSHSGRWWGTRTELMRSDAEFVAAHKDLLLERIEQHRAYEGLIRERLRLAALLSELWTVPSVISNPDPNAKSSDFTLSLDEISRMLEAMNVEPELRGAIMRMLTARLKEKLQ